MDIYLTSDLKIDHYNNPDFYAIGTDNRIININVPTAVGIELSIERPDHRLLGPFSYSYSEKSSTHTIYSFRLSELIFRKTGDIQATLRLTDDSGVIHVVNFTFYNHIAIPAYPDEELTDNLTLKQDILNLAARVKVLEDREWVYG